MHTLALVSGIYYTGHCTPTVTMLIHLIYDFTDTTLDIINTDNRQTAPDPNSRFQAHNP